MADPIKAIVRTFVSERDRNGNCYKFAFVYATAAGSHRFVSIDDPCHISTLLKNMAGAEYGTVLETEEVLPKRAWQAKRHGHSFLFDFTPECKAALAELFGVKVCPACDGKGTVTSPGAYGQPEKEKCDGCNGLGHITLDGNWIKGGAK